MVKKTRSLIVQIKKECERNIISRLSHFSIGEVAESLDIDEREISGIISD